MTNAKVFLASIGLLFIAGSAIAAPNFDHLPENVRKNLKGLKIGDYQAPIYKDRVLVGYATLTFESGVLVGMKKYDLSNAPVEVRLGIGASADACGGSPTVAFVASDANNSYYYATFPDGSWVYYGGNNTSGDITVIGSGRESSEIC